MSAEIQVTSDEAYRILKLDPGADDAQIKSAYRKLSLKLHPDKRRDVSPEVAAHDFHQLSAAYALLSDPVQRQKSEVHAAEQAAAAKRRGAYDSKRKAAADDLVRREEDDRKRRRAAAQAKADLDSRLREAQEESERLMRAATSREGSTQSSASADAGSAKDKTPYPPAADVPPSLGPKDRLVLIKLPTAECASLLGAPGEALLSLETLGSLDNSNTVLYRALEQNFGKVAHVVIQPPRRRKNGLSSEVTVLAEFEQLLDAYAAVTAGQKLAAPPPLDECWIGWALAGRSKSAPVEPARVVWMRSRGLLPPETKLGQHVPSTAPTHSAPSPRPAFPSKFPEAAPDFESATLQRLRDAARRRDDQENEMSG